MGWGGVGRGGAGWGGWVGGGVLLLRVHLQENKGSPNKIEKPDNTKLWFLEDVCCAFFLAH